MNLQKLSSLMILTAIMAACSAKVSSGGGDPTPVGPLGGEPQKTDVAGPDLQGHWGSQCVASEWGGNAKRKIELHVTGADVEYKVLRFSDEDCTKSSGEESKKGTMQYANALKDNGFKAKLSTPINANASSIIYFDVRKDADKVFVSDLFLDMEGNEEPAPSIELTAITESKGEGSNPAPAPAPTGPFVLKSGVYEDKTYNYCSYTVSTMKSGGVMAQVYLDSQPPCEPRSRTLTCEKDKCYGSNFEITVTSDRSFTVKNDYEVVTYDLK